MAKVKPKIEEEEEEKEPEPEIVEPAKKSVTCPDCITEFDPVTGDIIKKRADDEPVELVEPEPAAKSTFKDDEPEPEHNICPPLFNRERGFNGESD